MQGRRFDSVDAMLAGLAVMWGSAFVGIKVLGEVLDPYEMTWFRYALFPLAYGTWILARRRAVLAAIPGMDWVRFIVIGAIGILGYHFPLNWGMASGPGSVSAATGAILIATTPLWTLLIAVASRREALRPLALVGSLVAFAGVVIVVLLGRGSVQLDVAKRAAVVLLAPISWAIYSVASRPLIQRHGGLVVTGLTLGIGTFTLLPLGIAWGAGPLADFEPRHWAWLAFLSLGSTILGYAVWNHALKLRTASQVAVYVYFNPVVATVVGFLVLGDRITAWFAAGGALVLVGVVLVNQSRLNAAAAVPTPPRSSEKP